MIDVNKIRSLKTLEEIKRDLNEFLSNKDILDVYLTEYAWSVDDYEADKELVVELLERVDRRIASLSNFLKGKSKKRGSPQSPATETSKAPEAQ
jgi:hypothetical protein